MVGLRLPVSGRREYGPPARVVLMSLLDNKLYHERQAHRFGADGDRALDRLYFDGEAVAHVADYYRIKYVAHRAAYLSLLLAEAGEG